MQDPQGMKPADLQHKKKEKNEKEERFLFIFIILLKCEEKKCIIMKFVLSCLNTNIT